MDSFFVSNKRVTTLAPLVVGQRVHCILYGGRDGIVFGITGEQRPDTMSSLGGGAMLCGGLAEFDVVFSDGTVSRRLPEVLVRACVQWKVYGEVASAEQIQEALNFAAAETIRRRANEELRTEARMRRRDELKAQFSGVLALVAPDQGHKAHVIGSKNLLKQLRAAFPGVKFRCCTTRNSIDVSWEFGPTVKEASVIVDRYETGSFNGSNDLYETDTENVWPGLFGGAKYVNAHRSYGETFLEKAGRALCEISHVEYAGTNTCKIMGEHDRYTLGEHLWRFLKEVTMPVGVTDFTRLETCFGKETRTDWYNWLQLVF